MITAVISKKGGVGKTTTSVNLSAALAMLGRRVLLVDLDPNAGASKSLGVATRDLSPSSADVLLRGTPVGGLIRASGVPGLDLVTASVNLRGAEAQLGQHRRKDAFLQGRFDPVRRSYDFIFLDCPSSIGLVTRNAIAASDAFLVPAVPHFLAIEGMEHLIAAASRLALAAGARPEFLGIVLTLVDYRVKLTRRTVDELRGRFGSKVFAMEVRTNVSLAEAPGYGKTVFQYKPRSTGARAYRLLAEELLQVVEKSERVTSVAV